MVAVSHPPHNITTMLLQQRHTLGLILCAILHCIALPLMQVLEASAQLGSWSTACTADDEGLAYSMTWQVCGAGVCQGAKWQGHSIHAVQSVVCATSAKCARAHHGGWTAWVGLGSCCYCHQWRCYSHMHE